MSTTDLQQLLDFLSGLQQHNDKAWMEANKPAYQQARKTLLEVTELLIQEVGSFDPSVAALTPQQCIFRINRDVRFSKNKSPYKNHMGSFLAPGGRNSGLAGYYLHLAPNDQSFIAGGMYEPAPDTLKRIRQEIDYNGEDLVKILHTPSFEQLFGTLQGESLKRPPQGYSADHPHLALLKHKSFTVLHPVQDQAVVQPNFLSYVLKVFQAMQGLIQFLNTAAEVVEE